MRSREPRGPGGVRSQTVGHFLLVMEEGEG